jgi:hypothetical protein
MACKIKPPIPTMSELQSQMWVFLKDTQAYFIYHQWNLTHGEQNLIDALQMVLNTLQKRQEKHKSLMAVRPNNYQLQGAPSHF